MKLSNTGKTSLRNDNQDAVKAWGKEPLHKTPYFALLLVLGDMFDMLAGGAAAHCVSGATSNKSAFSITMNAQGGKDARYGASMEELATAVQDWL